MNTEKVKQAVNAAKSILQDVRPQIEEVNNRETYDSGDAIENEISKAIILLNEALKELQEG